MPLYGQIPYKLRRWVPEKMLDWECLHHNPKASEYLKEKPNKINWILLADNPDTIEVIEEFLEKKDLFTLSGKGRVGFRRFKRQFWSRISSNPNGLGLLSKNHDLIKWKHLSKNPSAMSILEKNQDKIDWDNLSKNSAAISLLQQNEDKINWSLLSSNPGAIKLLEQNLDKIDWKQLSTNVNAISILENNLDKICWLNLCKNPNGIYILYQYPHLINWEALSSNPSGLELFQLFEKKLRLNVFENSQAGSIIKRYIGQFKSLRVIQRKYWKLLSQNPEIFKIDYRSLKKRIEPFHEELIQRCFHPERLFYYLNNYDYDIGEDEYNS